jgi:hypothetical protein
VGESYGRIPGEGRAGDWAGGDERSGLMRVWGREREVRGPGVGVGEGGETVGGAGRGPLARASDFCIGYHRQCHQCHQIMGGVSWDG